MSTVVDPTDDTPTSWLRIPTDTDKSYYAFTLYRDLGPTRQLTPVAEQIGRHLQQVSLWNMKHHWRARARAFDADQEQQWLDVRAATRHTVAQRHAELSRQFQSKVLERLETLDANTLSPADTVRWMEIALKVERGVYGLDDPDLIGGVTNGLHVTIDARLLAPPTIIPPELEGP